MLSFENACSRGIEPNNDGAISFLQAMMMPRWRLIEFKRGAKERKAKVAKEEESRIREKAKIRARAKMVFKQKAKERRAMAGARTVGPMTRARTTGPMTKARDRVSSLSLMSSAFVAMDEVTMPRIAQCE